jgi:glycosyltransferase involved in cell wall biosynthesis
MKVLHLISSGGFYGAESMLLNLMAAQRRIGLEPSLLAFENRRNPHIEIVHEARRRHIDVETLDCQGRFDRSAIRRIAEVVGDRGIDVLHSHGYKSNFYGYAASARVGVPFIATCHLWTRSNATVRLYEALDAYVLRRADHVVGVSDGILDALRKSGMSPAKTSVIYNGIGGAAKPADEPSLRAELDIARDAPLVGAVARLEEQKGLRYFIEAAERVVLDLPQAVFVIVGDGSMRESLAESIRQKGLNHRVRLLGQRNDMSNIYASLDLFVLASLNEGLPMVLLEALSAALPVVATKVGAVPQVIDSGRSGLLVDPSNPKMLADSILACLRDKQFAYSLGMHGRATVLERFSSDTMSRQYLAVYERSFNKTIFPKLNSLTEA